jgi:hypothetical protein
MDKPSNGVLIAPGAMPLTPTKNICGQNIKSRTDFLTDVVFFELQSWKTSIGIDCGSDDEAHLPSVLQISKCCCENE